MHPSCKKSIKRGNPFDMPISKSKYDRTFLDSDVSEATGSPWVDIFEEVF